MWAPELEIPNTFIFLFSLVLQASFLPYSAFVCLCLVFLFLSCIWLSVSMSLYHSVCFVPPSASLPTFYASLYVWHRAKGWGLRRWWSRSVHCPEFLVQWGRAGEKVKDMGESKHRNWGKKTVMSSGCLKKYLTVGAGALARFIRTCAVLLRGLEFGAQQPCQEAYSLLELQLQGILHFLPASMSTALLRLCT